MQPNGRAEGESETKDRQKPFVCKLIYQNMFNNRFSAKEGASRSDQARPKTNIQVTFDVGDGDGDDDDDVGDDDNGGEGQTCDL